MSVKCIICMDSTYLAIHNQDPTIIVPMFNLTGSELSDYSVEQCSCQIKTEAIVAEEHATKLKGQKKKK